ncbi:hypothetical protein NGRA_1584 [Nosema granulosis]|uniref:Microsporidial 8TM transmembrane domain-containing protein n=1 Tax=Nosema granulosis TaxID=83296 RepID=A0A9P6KZ08_9MICR|nr:hypothetical protein NGRA_1584 [Nosema granulosis]
MLKINRMSVCFLLVLIRILVCLLGKDLFQNVENQRSGENIFYILTDILVAYNLNSIEYILVSMILPLDFYSLENLILSLMGTNHITDDLLYYLLCNFSIFYFPLSLQFLIDNLFISQKATSVYCRPIEYTGYFKKSLISTIISKYNLPNIFSAHNPMFVEYFEAYRLAHLPSLNITWFFFLHIFEQYSHLFYNYFYFIAVYLVKSVKKREQFEIICMFRSSSFKNWLPLVCKDESLHIYISFYVLMKYVDYLLNNEGLANPNFMNWISFLFILFFICKRFIKKISKR